MANTYTQIYIHMVFSVKGRESLIEPEIETEVHKMLTTILQNNGHKLIAIGGMPDHVHIFFGMSPKEALSNLVKEMKTATTAWINGQGKLAGKREQSSSLELPSGSKFGEAKLRGHFGWQEGYGAFSYSRSQIDAVAKYVLNQKNHHTKATFREEYLKMLQSFGIEYDERYVFQWIKEASPSGEDVSQPTETQG